LDIALWDIAGQAMEQPYLLSIGGACRERIRIYNTRSVRGKDGGQVFKEPEKLAESLLNEGITAIKVVRTDHLADEGHGYDFRAEDLAAAIAPLAKMRDAVGNDLDIAHDGHGKFSLTNAITVARAMEDYDLLWQEELLQPVNVETHLRLKQSTWTPICGAERLQTRYQFRDYIE
jgi:galactonate dehydratase